MDIRSWLKDHWSTKVYNGKRGLVVFFNRTWWYASVLTRISWEVIQNDRVYWTGMLIEMKFRFIVSPAYCFQRCQTERDVILLGDKALCECGVRTEDHSSKVVADHCPICGWVSFIRRGGLSLGVGGGIMGRELVWPFFVSSLLSFLSLCQLCSI